MQIRGTFRKNKEWRGKHPRDYLKFWAIIKFKFLDLKWWVPRTLFLKERHKYIHFLETYLNKYRFKIIYIFKYNLKSSLHKERESEWHQTSHLQIWNLIESENISKPLKDKDYNSRILFSHQILLIFKSMKMFITVIIIILKHGKELTCPIKVEQLGELRYIRILD